MQHRLESLYRENTHSDRPSWAIGCRCGWKEKASNEKAALERLAQHVLEPHKH